MSNCVYCGFCTKMYIHSLFIVFHRFNFPFKPVALRLGDVFPYIIYIRAMVIQILIYLTVCKSKWGILIRLLASPKSTFPCLGEGFGLTVTHPYL